MMNREVYRWLGRALLFIITGLLLLELFFRFAIQADQRPVSMRVDGGIMVFDTAAARDGHTSIGRVPLQRFHWHINDQGWNSTIDYLAPEDRDRPLIAVIGDSHVENLQSDVDESIASQLQTIVGDRALVYSFGKADQSLLQDLLLMDHVDSLFSPDTYVLVLGGDFLARSIIPDPGVTYSYLVPSGTGFTIAPPAPRERSEFALAALQSAIVRYLRFNTMLELFPLFRIPEGYTHKNALLSYQEVEEILPSAADHILQRLSQDYADKGVLIILNFFVTRYRIYDSPEIGLSGNLTEPTDFDLILRMAPDYEGIDCLNSGDAFEAAWERDRRRFESPDRKHLSGYGNRVIAEYIYERLQSQGTLDRLFR